MINLISSGFYGKTLHKVTKNLFKQLNINYANIVFHTETFKGAKAKKIDWVDYSQLVRIKQIPLDQNDLIPLDEELITKMSNCERVVLKMMERLEPYGKYQYQTGVNLYYLYLRYWNHIIEKNKINLFLSANVPHEGFDFVIYELCKLKNIPVLFLYHQSQITDTALIMQDWKKNSIELQKRYKYLKKHLGKKNEIKLTPQFEEQYQSQLSGGSMAIPFYMIKKTWLKRNISFVSLYFTKLFEPYKKNPSVLLYKIINPIKWVKLFYFVYQITIRRITTTLLELYYKIYYKRISKYPDLTKPYIYIALQYQPELSTSPLADTFVDQDLIVKMISKYAPKDVLIYVKEHPNQTYFCRDKNFYQNLLNTKNVVLVRKDTDSFELIENSLAVATSTGTPGWEALFRKKPVLMFGSYIYQFADGVFKITTNKNCIEAMNKIFYKNQKPSLKNTRIFLKALEEISIPAVIDPYYIVVSKLKESTNIKNITDALIREINKL